jgi:hypothetical protein
MNFMAYSILRYGEYCCYLKGANYCSLINKESVAEQIPFKYKVCIKTDGLDNNGFITDQSNIQSYFDNVESSDISCEKMAYNAVFYFHELLKKCNCKALFIKVSISPPPYVSEIGFSLGRE